MKLDEIEKVVATLGDAGVLNDHTICDFCVYNGKCGELPDASCESGVSMAVEARMKSDKTEESGE